MVSPHGWLLFFGFQASFSNPRSEKHYKVPSRPSIEAGEFSSFVTAAYTPLSVQKIRIILFFIPARSF